MKNKKKYIVTSLLLGATVMSVGCSQSAEETAQTQTQESKEHYPEPTGISLYGEISNIENNVVTLKMGTPNFHGGPDQGGKKGHGEKPKMAENENGEQEFLTFSGEEKTIVIDGSIKMFTMSFGGNEKTDKKPPVSLKDLQIGDVLKLQYTDEEEMEFIELMFGEEGPNEVKKNNKQ